jgi:hypothetical protein
MDTIGSGLLNRLLKLWVLIDVTHHPRFIYPRIGVAGFP